MRTGLTRGGVVVTILLALLGLATSPVYAELVVAIAFIGTADLAGPGFGFFCKNDTGPGGTTTIALDPFYLCPGVENTLLSTLPLPHTPEDLVPNAHIHFNHNRHGIFVTSLACLGVGSSPLKLHTADEGTCTLAAAGTIDGHCGLNGGQLSGTLTLLNILGGLPQTFVFDIHFNGIGPTLILTGHVTNTNTGQNGLLVGIVNAIAPNPATTPGQSCFNLTARTFTLVGEVAAYTRAL